MNFSSGTSINALIDAPSLKIGYLPEGFFLFHGMFRFCKIKSHAKQLDSSCPLGNEIIEREKEKIKKIEGRNKEKRK